MTRRSAQLPFPLLGKQGQLECLLPFNLDQKTLLAIDHPASAVGEDLVAAAAPHKCKRPNAAVDYRWLPEPPDAARMTGAVRGGDGKGSNHSTPAQLLLRRIRA